MDNLRLTYTNEEKDVTIIEIKKEDGLNFDFFLEMDELMYKDTPKEEYKNKSIYILHYEYGKKAKYSVGKIIFINEDNFTIRHNCTTQTGSSGSVILNLNNHKVIGVHKGSNKSFNVGSLLKDSIEDFNRLNKNPNLIKEDKKPTKLEKEKE